MNTRFIQHGTGLKSGIALTLATLLFSIPLFASGPRGGAPAPRGPSPAPRAPAPRPVVVDRSSHGSVRHVETHVVERPVEVRREPEHPVEVRHDAGHPVEVRHEIDARHDFQVHHDVEADVNRHHVWNDFSYGRRHDVLPLGYIGLQIAGASYFYDDGVYYQPSVGGYQEVYPPVGADIPQPPDGSIEVDAGGRAYFYAGGAFYLQQPDGTYAITQTPIGVVVPELPPGAVQVAINGSIAYQFNGVCYEPVFVNGVTQYQTFIP